MKKLVSLALSAISAVALLGATMVKVDDPKVGEVAYSGFGRLAYVDVFSTNDTGTVKLDRVFKTVTYTNAYDITVSSVTNIVETPVFGDRYWKRHDGIAYTNASTTEVFSPRFLSSEDPSDYMGWSTVDERWTVMERGRKDWDRSGVGLDGAFVAFKMAALSFEKKHDFIRTDLTTNIVTKVTTNGVRAVKCYDLEVTNNVFNGSCSGKFFRGTPDTEFWMFKGDRLLFNGTATGGALRLVIE